MQRINDFYYGWCATAADINRDGILDVISGPFYFLGPDYTERREFTAARTYNPSNQFSRGMVNFADDFTGDSWPDILMVDQRPIYLYVNLTANHAAGIATTSSPKPRLKLSS